MKTPAQPEQLQNARRILPLLRSYAREIRERTSEIDILRVQLGHPSDPRVLTMRALEASLATHRREIRRLKQELARLGWRVGSMSPLQLVHGGEDGSPEVVWSPSDANARAVDSAA